MKFGENIDWEGGPLLTLSLRDIRCVDTQCDITLLEVALWWDLIWSVKLVEHFYTAILHHLFRTQGCESEFEEVGLLRRSLNHIFTLVVVVEGLGAE